MAARAHFDSALPDADEAYGIVLSDDRTITGRMFDGKHLTHVKVVEHEGVAWIKEKRGTLVLHPGNDVSDE